MRPIGDNPHTQPQGKTPRQRQRQARFVRNKKRATRRVRSEARATHLPIARSKRSRTDA